jgi:choline dehydrogenase-like flavoprotein
MAARIELTDGDAIVVIGSGAGGATVANELAQRGASKVVILEAGRHFTIADYENDEIAMFMKMSWLDKRRSAGSWEHTRDSPDMPVWHAKAVGGTTNFYTALTPRLLPQDFAARTTYGDVADANLLDWPVTYEEMQPYYDLAEKKMGVAGSPASGLPPLPKSNKYKLVEAGARKIGYVDVAQPMAINSQPYDGRAACQQSGFCIQGCKFGAKWSTLYTEIPKALETGRVELRPESMALQIEHDSSGTVTGVVYADKDGNHQLQKARIVCVAGNSIESPRLLLNSASSLFPHGLANSSGEVGRNYMTHAQAGGGFSIFKGPVHMYRGTATSVIVRDEMAHKPSRGFVGGYALVGLGLGLPFTSGFIRKPGAWGREYTSAIDKYENMICFYVLGEQMPMKQNGVTLHPTEKDQHGLPIPIVSCSSHANDGMIRAHGMTQWKNLVDSVGAVRTIEGPDWRAPHNLGTNRMSAKPRDGVLNRWGQAHDVKNLFVSDGSVFTTGGCANPTLTIVALAIRQAEAMTRMMERREI